MDFIKKEKILNLISEKLIILRILVKSIPSPNSTCTSEPWIHGSKYFYSRPLRISQVLVYLLLFQCTSLAFNSLILLL